jgi:four helix bundle protein
MTPLIQERRLRGHEKLDVYQLAIEFVAFALRLLDDIPRQRREVRSQLERAAMSVPLNIAEGCGKPSAADRARYLAIARGSALECGAVLDVCGLIGHATPEQIEEGKRTLGRIVAMLTKMCR